MGLGVFFDGVFYGFLFFWFGYFYFFFYRVVSGIIVLFRNIKVVGVVIGGVKNMFLEWCRVMIKKYEVGME